MDGPAICLNRSGRQQPPGRLIHEGHKLIGEAGHGAADRNATYMGTTANLSHPSALAYVALNHSAPASEFNDALGGPIGNFVGLLAPSSADDFLLQSRRSASISDRRL